MQLFTAWDQATGEQTHNCVLLSDILDLDYPEFDAIYDYLQAEGSRVVEVDGRDLFIKTSQFRRSAPRVRRDF